MISGRSAGGAATPHPGWPGAGGQFALAQGPVETRAGPEDVSDTEAGDGFEVLDQVDHDDHRGHAGRVPRGGHGVADTGTRDPLPVTGVECEAALRQAEVLTAG